jgi:hypothetical protein
MPVNKFVVIGAISLVSVGAIAFVNNALFEEEKRMARLKLKSAESSCILLISDQKMLEFAEREFKKAPFDDNNLQQKRHYEENVDNGKKACQKILDYEEKYREKYEK